MYIKFLAHKSKSTESDAMEKFRRSKWKRPSASRSWIAVLVLCFGTTLMCQRKTVSADGGIFYVIEPFEAIRDEWAVHSYNDQGFLDLKRTSDAMFGQRALKVNYQVVQTENWGGFAGFQWNTAPDRVHNCIDATHMSFWYKVLQPQSSPGRVHLRLIVSDDSDCPGCHDSILSGEVYYTFHNILDESDEVWREIRIPLRGDSDVESPFWRSGWSGTVGNNRLDANRLAGFKIEFSIDSQGDMNSSSSGDILLDQLACVGGGKLLGSAFHGLEGTYQDAIDAGYWEDLDENLNPARLDATQSIELTGGMFVVNASLLNASRGNLVLRHRTTPPSYYNLTGLSQMALQYQNELSNSSNIGHVGIGLVTGIEANVSYNELTDPIVTDKGKSAYWVINNNFSTVDLSTVTELWIEIDLSFTDEAPASASVISVGNLVGGIANTSVTDSGNTLFPDHLFYREVDLLIDIADSKSFQKLEFLANQCCEICDVDPTCLFVVTQYSDCYVASELAPRNVRIPDSAYKQESIDSYVTTSPAKRGDYCDVCHCVPDHGLIDCQGKGLRLVPMVFSAAFLPKILDLRQNPDLLILDSQALAALSWSLGEIRLPANMAHISPKALVNTMMLLTMTFEVPEVLANSAMDRVIDTRQSNFILSDEGFFQDVCCRKGRYVPLSSSKLHFCEMVVDSPGIDSTSEPFMQYVDPKRLATLQPSSPFLAEAAESPEKCAEFCSITEGCLFYSFDSRLMESEHSCYLLSDNGTRTDFVCCNQNDYADEAHTLSGWTSGKPPRTRHELDNARVVISRSKDVLNTANKYSTEVEVSLGSNPIRGAVWIEPVVSTDTSLTVSISPQRIVLYDNETTSSIQISISNVNALTSGETIVVTHRITSCDSAFDQVDPRFEGDLSMELDVEVNVFENNDQFVLIAAVVVPFILFASCLSYILLRRRHTDSLWTIKASELDYGHQEPKIIGRGSFGFVVLAEYHGTEVAVKRMWTTRQKGDKDGWLERSKSFGTSSWKSSNGEVDVEAGLSFLMGARKKSGEVLNTDPDTRLYSSQKKKFVEEIRVISQLRHPCIATMIGAVVSPKEEPLLIMEYMQHGSLHDVIHNDTVFLDGEQIHSILQDVVKGMRYLHAVDPQVVHGDLKAQNILISNNFRAKVSDFGLSHSRKNWLGAVGSPYWMAPELLRCQSMNTDKSDCYSFGILLYEVYSRREPYEGEDYRHVLRLVRDPVVCKRPPYPENMPEKIGTMMRDCLLEKPEDRTSFEDLDFLLRGFSFDDIEPLCNHWSRRILNLSGDNKNGSPEYASFPQHIADALRAGRRVETESRAMVTIFYASIARLSDFSSFLGPKAVSDRIDQVFMKLDRLAGGFDLFRIETVGDKYMVVGNLVKDQADDHTKRIVDFALAAISATSNMMIDEKYPHFGFISLRVGCHSGAVLADVIGSKTPRYCLFGESLTTVFAMENRSLPGQIHCSETTAGILRSQSPHFTLVPRGVVKTNGHQRLTTYWVSPGRSSFSLPCIELGRGISSAHSTVHCESLNPQRRTSDYNTHANSDSGTDSGNERSAMTSLEFTSEFLASNPSQKTN